MRIVYCIESISRMGGMEMTSKEKKIHKTISPS